MIPKSWTKHGEIFSDEDSRSVFVCSTCVEQKNTELEFLAFDAAAFWSHIQKHHMQDDENVSRSQRRSSRRSCSNEKSIDDCVPKKAKVQDIIRIDIDDDDDDEGNSDKIEEVVKNENENDAESDKLTQKEKYQSKGDSCRNEESQVNELKSEPKQTKDEENSILKKLLENMVMDCEPEPEILSARDQAYKEIPKSITQCDEIIDLESDVEDIDEHSAPQQENKASHTEAMTCENENSQSQSGENNLDEPSVSAFFLNNYETAENLNGLAMPHSVAESNDDQEVFELSDDDSDSNDSVDTDYFSGLTTPPLSISNGGNDGEPNSSSVCTRRECGNTYNGETHEQLPTTLIEVESQATPLLSPAVSPNVHLSEMLATTSLTDRSHKCCHCEKAFCHMWQLDRHKLVHSHKPAKQHCHKAKRPIPCIHCGKRTSTVERMRVHVKRFHSDGSHPETTKCDRCGKVILTVNLRQHMDVHLNYFKYKCQLCQYEYKQKQSLQAHLKKVHGHSSRSTAHSDNNSAAERSERQDLPNSLESQLTEDEAKLLYNLYMNAPRQPPTNDVQNAPHWNFNIPPFITPFPQNFAPPMLPNPYGPYFPPGLAGPPRMPPSSSNELYFDPSHVSTFPNVV